MVVLDYAFLRFNTNLRQLQREIGMSCKTMYPRVERFTRALNAHSLDLVGPVEIDELHVSAGKKTRECDSRSRSRGFSTRGRGSYKGDKPFVFIFVDRGTHQRYVVLAKTVDEPMVRPLLANRQQESLVVYTDCLRA